MRTPPATVRSRPRFVESVDFMRRTRGKWKWQILTDVVVVFDGELTHRLTAYRMRQDKHTWGTITGNVLTIRAGYSWDGSTCSPDFSGVMLSSLVHDFYFQFSGCVKWPAHLNRDWANAVFLELATSRLRYFYALGLFLFSRQFWGKQPTRGELVDEISLIDAT